MVGKIEEELIFEKKTKLLKVPAGISDFYQFFPEKVWLAAEISRTRKSPLLVGILDKPKFPDNLKGKLVQVLPKVIKRLIKNVKITTEQRASIEQINVPEVVAKIVEIEPYQYDEKKICYSGIISPLPNLRWRVNIIVKGKSATISFSSLGVGFEEKVTSQ